MKGIIFNLVQEVVVQAHGEDAWDDILDAAGLDGAYTSLGSYPDDDLFRLVAAASSLLGADAHDVVRSLGEGAIPLLAERFPEFFEHPSTLPFVLTLNDIIHPEVRKLYPGADVPEFDFDDSSPDSLSMGYRSPRKLCALAEGLIEGAADQFEETVSIAQSSCMNRGDEKCTLVISFQDQGDRS